MRTKIIGCLGLLALASPGAAQIRINEIQGNTGLAYDGAEYIEIYNAGASADTLDGWVLTGTEFAGTCGGEDHWQFPSGTILPAGGYLVVTRDNIDTAPGEPDDGFLQQYGFNADFEMYDFGRSYETDDAAVPNLVLLTQQAGFDDQIRFIPGGSGGGDYGRSCAGQFNQYEALYLYDGVPGGGGVSLVDVMEYRDPVTCGTADQCLGVGASDTDGFSGLPGVGESLGRNALSADTGNSGADFFLSTPTPKAVNIPNAGPTLSTLAVNNPDPKGAETATVTISATDANGIGSVYLVKSVNGGAVDSTLMTNTIGSTYSATIPAQADQAQVVYFVRARDAGAPAGVSKYPFSGSRKIRWGTQTIFQCQFHSPASDTGQSAEVGKAVNVHGVVTTETGPFNVSGNAIFTIQNGAGFWNGIYVFDDVGTTTVNRGDSVRVAGEVTEFGDRTEIVIYGIENVTVLATGRPLPGPFAATASQLTTGASFGELLEGVYSRLTNVAVTSTFTFGEWGVTDGTGSCRVNGASPPDPFRYLYSPTIGDSLDVVQGIVDFSFLDRKMEPRDDGDIQGPPLVSNVRYSPIPPTFAGGAITVSSTITDNGTIPRAKLKYKLAAAALYDSTDLVNTVGTTWAKAIGPYADGTEIDYHIEITDNDGFNGRSPSAGDYDFYVGFRTIETIQSTLIAGSDSSSFEGKPTNVAGIVTQAPGTIADNIFVIQNHWTVTPANRGVHVYSGGSLVGQIELGDSVAVSGDVDEYYGLTQIRMHFTEAWQDRGNVPEIQGFPLLTSAFGPDSTGAVPASEPWEGVLLQFNGSTVTNAAAGFGQYYLDNTAPSTSQETLVDDEARVSGLTYVPIASDMKTYRGIGDFTFGQYKLQPRDDSDILPFNPADAVDSPVVGAALAFALHQNSPNPAGSVGTRISFAIPRAAHAELRVFDVQGRLVRTLVDGPVEAGRHVADWNGNNAEGKGVAPGVYFYRLTAGEDEATRKMVFLR